MRLIEHIKNDWSTRVPCLLRHNRYQGLSRLAYAILCLLYHVVKTAILLFLCAYFRVVRLVFWDSWIWIFKHEEYQDDYEDEEEPEEETEDEEDAVSDEGELLPFCQLFTVGNEMCLLVDHVEMCPEETAFIRVVDDEGYTPLYKRKVRRDKQGKRYLTFSGRDYYLDDSKTHPTVSGRK